MSETLSIVLVFALLVVSIPSVALVILLARHLTAQARATQTMAALTERAVDLLAARSPEEFLRLQTSRSTSLMYPPNDDEPDLGQLDGDGDDDAYQQALELGVPDDVAQYLED